MGGLIEYETARHASDDLECIVGRACRAFFLRGHMRSGTNWCARLLNLHPRVLVKGEFHLEIIASAVKRFTGADWSMGSREPLRSSAHVLLEEFVRRSIASIADEKPGATWLGDQTPYLIEPLLSGARHIVMLRDGRDVLVSWTFHQLRRGGPPDEPFRSEMAQLTEMFARDPNCFKERPELLLSRREWVMGQARSWRNYIREHLATRASVERGEIDASLLFVRYEDLHAETEAWRRRMYEFLDLDPDEAEAISAKSLTTAGFKRGEDPTSFFRKGEVGDWRNYFTDESRDWFNEEAGAELVALGYASDQDWTAWADQP